jgi:hypothetical protein
MTAGNDEFMKIMEEYGFTWFRKLHPPLKKGGK